MRLWFVGALAGVAFCVFGLVGARAGTTGGILGYVNDTLGHSVAGVHVSAVAPSGRAATTTGAMGFYALNGLPLDTYTVTFAKDGYLTQAISDITTIQGQSIRVNARLEAVKTLAQIPVRSSSSLVQPTVTADTYVVNQGRLSDINGTPQDINGFLALESLPGVFGDVQPLAQNTYPTIRAGNVSEVGWRYDGVDVANPAIGIFDLGFLPLNGVHNVQLSTGGYDVSEGNTNSGVINEVIKRGTYPPAGQATMRITSPIFGHELSFDYGGATPNGRFSYYLSVGGQRDAFAYGDRSTLLPLQLGNFVFQSLNDNVLNLFYHFGQGNRDELQFLGNVTAYTANFSYLADPALAPYASNNGDVQAASDPFGLRNFSTFESSYLTLFPGQVAHGQDTGVADSVTEMESIDKINFKRQLTPSSFLDLRVFQVSTIHRAWIPYDSGSFTDLYFFPQTTAVGEALDYTEQLDAKHELSVGADGLYHINQDIFPGSPSFEPFSEPLEALGCPQAATALGMVPVGGCYIAPFNAALNARLGLGLPTDPGHAPLSTYASDLPHATSPVHRWDVYVKDRYQPTDRLTITLGLRWDKQVISLPSNAAELNTTYYINDSGNVVTVPGQPIGSDVTQPSQVSPRLAMSYQLSPRDALRLSYGKNIEFEPLIAVEGDYQVPGSLQKCNIANGCFLALPGYGATNHVTNLYQEVMMDLNTHLYAQYTPVLPETAENLDFSYEHDFRRGLQLRVTPYYRKGTNYVVGTQQLLFTLPSGTPVFGPPKSLNAGINESTGIELAVQRNSRFGVAGLLAATYDNTLANYRGDFVGSANSAALASGHLFHVAYVSPLTGTLNLSYNTPTGLHASTTISFESGYRYGVGKKTFVFDSSGNPVQVLNTDLAVTPSQAYYFTDPTNPGTMFAPNITGSRGTPEGDDPGTLFTPATAILNLTLSHDVGRGPHNFQIGVRGTNPFGNYTPTFIPANVYYVPQGIGGYGPGSGFNVNQCAPGQTFACEPFRYNQSVYPYESEPSGLPRVYTFFLSAKY